MREVLKKLLRVGLVVALLLAPVVISSTAMEGEVWASGVTCPNGVVRYMGAPEVGASQTSQQLKNAGACSFDHTEYSGKLKEIARLGYSNGWINGYVGGFYSDIGQSAPIEKELSNREIEAECEKQGITGVSGLDECVTIYNNEYSSGRGDGQEYGEARGNEACPDGGCSVGSNGEVITPSGGEDEEDESGNSGGGTSGGNSSGGNSSGGNSSGGGSSSGSGGGTYEPGTGSGMDGSTSTNILPDDWKIADILRFIVNVLMYGLGAAATIGVVIAGIQYLTARDNEQQVVAAKRRLFNVVLGLAAWAMLYTLLHWLIPGFNDDLLEGEKEESGMVVVEESEIAKETGFSL